MNFLDQIGSICEQLGADITLQDQKPDMVPVLNTSAQICPKSLCHKRKRACRLERKK